MAEKTLSNQSIEKMFQIIEVMVEAGRPMRLNDISTICDISASTALRILNTVINCGYAHQDPETQLYYLSYKFVKIGNTIRQNSTLNQILHPYLQEISDKLNIASATAVWTKGGIVYTDEVAPASRINYIRITHHLGHVVDPVSTAAGKLFLAQMSHEQLKEHLTAFPPAANTPNTMVNLASLESNLSTVAAQGYAVNNEESAFGMRCIAIPVNNSDGKTIATISVSGTVYQLSSELLPMAVSIMVQLRDRIAKECGGIFSAFDFPIA